MAKPFPPARVTIVVAAPSTKWDNKFQADFALAFLFVIPEGSLLLSSRFPCHSAQERIVMLSEAKDLLLSLLLLSRLSFPKGICCCLPPSTLTLAFALVRHSPAATLPRTTSPVRRIVHAENPPKPQPSISATQTSHAAAATAPHCPHPGEDRPRPQEAEIPSAIEPTGSACS